MPGRSTRRGQNRAPIGANPFQPPRRLRAKSPPRLTNVGGRPLSFIPDLVVQAAAILHQRLRRWAAVLVALEQSGNGRWPRNTLVRRVRNRRSQNGGRRAWPELLELEMLGRAETPLDSGGWLARQAPASGVPREPLARRDPHAAEEDEQGKPHHQGHKRPRPAKRGRH